VKTYSQLKQITMSNLKEIENDWIETKAKLKQKFAKLTNNDLMLLDGKKDELLARIQLKLGKTKEEVLNIIASL